MSLKQRMYVLVPYNLSPIQKGIQALHAVVRYERSHGDTPEYAQWADYDETVIILDGGTSNTHLTELGYKGTLNSMMKDLIDNQIKVGTFYEEDINNALTGVAFVVDERVWDKVTYPDFDTLDGGNYLKFGLFMSDEHKGAYLKWVESIGGDKNLYLRDFLKTKRLAN